MSHLHSRALRRKRLLKGSVESLREPAPLSIGGASSAVSSSVSFRVYARASDPVQDTSVEQQINVAEIDLKKLGVLAEHVHLPRCHSPANGVFVDDGISAWKVPPTERPGSAQLMQDLAEHRQSPASPGIIWVWAQSRLLRPEHGAAEAVAQLFDLSKLGWTVLSHEQGHLDMTGPEALSRTISVALNGEKDAAHSREKQKAVIRAKHRQVKCGYWLGGFPPFGYERWAATCSSSVDTTEMPTITGWIQRLPGGTQNGIQHTVTLLRPSEDAPEIKMIFSLVADGEHGRVLSIYEIMRRLNRREQVTGGLHKAWTRASLFSVLKNETYIALQRDPNDRPHRALWEPLIDRALWDRVQTRLATNAKQTRGVNTDFALSGLLFCTYCGDGFTGERHTSPNRAVRRYYRTSFGRKIEKGNKCTACRYRIDAGQVEAQVLNAVAAFADQPAVHRAIADERASRKAGKVSLATEQERLKGDAKEVHRQIDNLIHVLEAGGAVAERVQARLAELNARAVKIEQQLAAISSGTHSHAARAFSDTSASFASVWAKSSASERKGAIRCLVARIEVDTVRAVVRIGARRVR